MSGGRRGGTGGRRAVPLAAVPLAAVLLLAGVLTGLNAIKPLHVDDAYYVDRARHVAADPLAPYGGEAFWYQEPQPAFDILAPPVLLYWLAPAVRLGAGDLLLKLWLLPVALLLVASLASLARRFAPAVAPSLVAFVALSPFVLPGFNLMLDVPALALSLAALACLARAVDRDSAVLAGLAGLLAGVAMQTKYSALAAPLVLAAYAGAFGAARLGLVALLGAAIGGGAIELAIVAAHGRSHFLVHATAPPLVPGGIAIRSGPLLAHLGALGLPLLILALAGLGWMRTRLATLLTLGVAAMAVALGLAWGGWIVLPATAVRWPVSAGMLVLALLAVAQLALLAAAGARLVRGRPPNAVDRDGVFLAVWLAVEIAVTVAITPFAAARRLLGVFVSGAFVAAALASRRSDWPGVRRGVHVAAAASVAAGMLVWVVDWHEATAVRLLAEVSAARAAAPEAGTVWFTGHWGFQEYGRRAGMRALVPDASRLLRGDRVVVPDRGIDQQRFTVAGRPLREIDVVTIDDGVPLRVLPGYYGSLLPLSPRRLPRRTARIYRVETEFVAGR